MPSLLILLALVAAPFVITFLALTSIGSTIALLAEQDPLVGRAGQPS